MIICGIVAGGSGSRMGNTQLPKQFMKLCGKPIIIRSIEQFLCNSNIDSIVVAVSKDYLEFTQNLINEYFIKNANIFVIIGGCNRTQTVNNIVDFSVEKLGANDETVFVTHDAVRPLISQDIINSNIELVHQNGVCNTAIPATDTIIQSSDGRIINKILCREEIYQAQTPQSFKLQLYNQVYNSCTKKQLEEATDTCSLFYNCSKKVAIARGSSANIKITYIDDLKVAEALLK